MLVVFTISSPFALGMTPEQTQAGMKGLPKYVIDGFKEGCKAGNKTMCFPLKCRDGDLEACKQHTIEVEKGFKKLKTMSPRQKNKAMFPTATDKELDEYESLNEKCTTKDKVACDKVNKMFKEFTVKSLKLACDKGSKPSCEALKQFEKLKL